MSNQTNHITFNRGSGWIGLFVVALVLYLVGTRLLGDVLRVGPVLPGSEITVVEGAVQFVPLVLALWFLRAEGVSLAGIGLSRDRIVPALVAVTGFYVLLNAVGIGLVLPTAGASAIGYQWTVSPVMALAAFVNGLIFAALIEEVAFRGYLQSKVIAVLPSTIRFRGAIGAITASVLFTLAHVPRILTSGIPGSQALATYGALLLFSGLAFGLLYEYTQNLYVPILIHAAGNMPGTIGIVFFDSSTLQGGTLAAYTLLYLALVASLVVVYRRVAIGSLKLQSWSGGSGESPEGV
ncbi:putative protease of the Abi (CAAX) family protein [Halorubrum californiense DSM 19288]|uniref:Putative protease of the Abi (CAAX) family protein n=1 Tax=Halorubrum californiense DSM 19288 TaxID=1227465 RepID=M0E2N6_9EURY|nr:MULTISPECIES: type II CAAX endopeptidase family protein [Halorubrum]ELZ42031.1 putative protease of the Abi (CAAX) family protein [Halorubrum californiense DSM 19288]TKX65415.1 CPBP family intramembrane metalloprotease [Halorubrum sp. GN11GM_10-3_MGM]